MGISSLTNRVSFTGDGSSTIFSFPYYFFTTSDLQVFLYDTNSSIVVAQALNTNYTVSGVTNSAGVYPSGGNVVMNSAFPSNLQLIITRDPSRVQNFALNQNGPISSQSIVQQFDYLTTLVQRLQDEVARCVQLPDGLGTISSNTFDPHLPQSTPLASSAGAPLILNSGATGWQFGLVATGPSGPVSYMGILPPQNGGTGQGGGFVPMGVWYSAGGSSMTMTAAGATPTVLTGQGLATGPIFSLLNLQSSVVNTLQVGNGGTGTATSYVQYGMVIMSSATQMISTGAGGQDVPMVGNAGAGPSFQPLNLASGSSTTNALAANKGGTGLTSFSPQFGVMYASSATVMSIVPSAAQDTLLTATGSSAPNFSTVSLGSSAGLVGVLPISKGGTGQITSSSAFIALLPSLSAAKFLTNNGTQVAWGSPAGSALNLSTQTAPYTSTNTDDVILAASGCSTVGLYAVAGQTGKILRIKKISTGFDAVTISPNSAFIYDGTSVVLSSPFESVELACDGTNWSILERAYPSQWTSYTPATTTGLGTVTIAHCQWKRIGDSIMIDARFNAAVVSASTATWALPTGLTVSSSISASSAFIGSFTNIVNGSNPCTTLAIANATALNFGVISAGAGGLTPVTANNLVTAGFSCGFFGLVPIQGWQG